MKAEEEIRNCRKNLQFNEERMRALRSRTHEMEELEEDFSYLNQKDIETMYASSGWRGEKATKYALRMEQQLHDSFHTLRNAYLQQYDECEEHMKDLLAEADSLRERVQELMENESKENEAEKTVDVVEEEGETWES